MDLSEELAKAVTEGDEERAEDERLQWIVGRREEDQGDGRGGHDEAPEDALDGFPR